MQVVPDSSYINRLIHGATYFYYLQTFAQNRPERERASLGTEFKNINEFLSQHPDLDVHYVTDENGALDINAVLMKTLMKKTFDKYPTVMLKDISHSLDQSSS